VGYSGERTPIAIGPATQPLNKLAISCQGILTIDRTGIVPAWVLDDAETRATIEQICRDCGYKTPSICSPDELMGD